MGKANKQTTTKQTNIFKLLWLRIKKQKTHGTSKQNKQHKKQHKYFQPTLAQNQTTKKTHGKSKHNKQTTKHKGFQTSLAMGP